MRSRDVTNTRLTRIELSDSEILRSLVPSYVNDMYRQKRKTFRPMMRLLFPPEKRPRLRALPLGLDLAKCAIRF